MSEIQLPRNPRIRNRHGRCYELSWNAVIDFPEWELIHGEVASPGVTTSGRMLHAWVERDGVAYDPVLDKAYAAERYAAIFNAVRHARYSPKDAAKMMRKHNHMGPWPVDESALSAEDIAFARKIAKQLRCVTRYRQSPEPLLALAAQLLYSCQLQAEYFALGGGDSLTGFLGPASEDGLINWARDTLRGLATFERECLPLLRQQKYKTADRAAQGIDGASALLAARLAG